MDFSIIIIILNTTCYYVKVIILTENTTTFEEIFLIKINEYYCMTYYFNMQSDVIDFKKIDEILNLKGKNKIKL